MQLTHTRGRRIGGSVSLLAALTLLLAVFVAPAAMAADDPCDQLGYEKINTSSGTHSDTWGSIEWGGDGDSALNSLVYDLEDGWQIEICLKAGNVDNTLAGPFTGSGEVFHNNPDLSHIGYIVSEVPPAEADPGADAEFCVDGGVLITLTNAPGEAGPGDPVTFDVYVDIFDDGPGSAFTTTELLDIEVAYGDTETRHVAIDEDVYVEIKVYTNDNPSTPFAEFNDTQDCEDPIVNAPAASIADSCELGAVVVTLDNTGSDETVTYTVTVNGVSTDHDVAPSDDPLVLTFPIEEDGAYDVTVVADGLDPVSASGTLDCEDPTPTPTPTPTPDASEPEPDSGVLPDATERPNPAPDPAPVPDPAPEPDPEPAPQVEAAQEQLPETGMESMDLLLLALLLAGLGTALLLAPAPRRNDGFAA